MDAVSKPLFKFAMVCHRWLGLALCWLFVLWFVSGMVMMYRSFPEVGPAERLAKQDKLKPEAVNLAPLAAFDRLRDSEPPGEAQLSMLEGRPVYRFRIGSSQASVYADNGEIARGVPAQAALRIAAAWVRLPGASAHFDGVLTRADQWTVSGEYRALRPLLKYSFPDGQQVYISEKTGEVVQHTTRASRLVAYFGAIPHWLYFTPLRDNGPLWNKVVVWLSGAGTVLCILGLTAGLWLYAPSKPSSIPYRGMKRWHMILGLTFGALACTWAFSGMLSMEPFEWLQGASENASRIDSALHGQRLDLKAFGSSTPQDAIRRSGIHVKTLEMMLVGGVPYYFARESPQLSRIVPACGGAPFDRFDSERILKLVAQAAQPDSIAETRIVSQYEAYYLDRHRRHPLPVLFVRLNDAHDSAYYIDLKTAQIVETYDNHSRWNRWLYHGLHSWDLPWLYRHRPAWDILVLTLLLGGAALSVSAVIIGLRLLRRTLRPRRTMKEHLCTPFDF